MKIIAGLGNPTDQYKGTRHNVGYMVINELARRNGINVNQHKFRSMAGAGYIGGQRVILLKPITYMNLSGQAIQPAGDFFKIDPEDLLVIYDDINLEPGMLRIRTKGGAGGHNGMKSIIQQLGGETGFPRVRVGIGGEKHPGMDLADYVLGHFGKEEIEKIEEAVDKAASACELFAQDRLGEAMNRYSTGKKKKPKKKTETADEETKTDPSPEEVRD